MRGKPIAYNWKDKEEEIAELYKKQIVLIREKEALEAEIRAKDIVLIREKEALEAEIRAKDKEIKRLRKRCNTTISALESIRRSSESAVIELKWENDNA